MSARTHLWSYALFFGSISSLLASPAVQCDELDEIQSQREMSQMEYLHKASVLKDATPAQRKELYQQVVGPSIKRLADFSEKASKANAPGKIGDEELDLSQTKTLDPSLLTVSDSTSGTSNSVKGNRPEYTLDGSNVPKEIEFAAPQLEPVKKAN